MAWEARSGLKLTDVFCAKAHVPRLNGLGSPFGFETIGSHKQNLQVLRRLNGLGSPFGFETSGTRNYTCGLSGAKWPGKPVRV